MTKASGEKFVPGKVNEYDGVLVVGAGLVGSLAALMLAQRGIKVALIERYEDWEVVSSSEGDEEQEKSTLKRSINLALSHRGKEALKKVGVLDQVMKLAIPMYGRAIHTNKDSETCEPNMFQPYDEWDHTNYINSVGREDLNKLLVSKAREHAHVTVMFGMRLTHVDKEGVAHFEDRADQMSSMSTYNDFTPGRIQIRAELVLGCDGAHSAVRESMLRLSSMNLERTFITHGYKELCIEPSASGDFKLSNAESLHIWPRGDFMMIGLPNPNKTFTCTVFAPLRTVEENGKTVPGLRDLKTDEQIKSYFSEHFPDVTRVMPDYVEQFKQNPCCRLVMVRASPWNVGGRMLIIGDAAHAQVPFYGQGMNSGFEDVLVFDETLDECEGKLYQAVEKFAKLRQPDGVAIANLSLRNYTEMRSHTGSYLFLLRKKLEGVLNYLAPNTWIPLYKMVSFTRLRYSDAISREQTQERILTGALCSLGVASVAIGAIAARYVISTSKN